MNFVIVLEHIKLIN